MPSLCSHTHSHPCFTQICAVTLVHQYQYTDGLNLCTVLTTHSHIKSPHRFSASVSQGRYTYSHHCIPTLSFTQPKDLSLTLMHTFSHSQHALVWLCNHATCRWEFPQRNSHPFTLSRTKLPISENQLKLKAYFLGKYSCEESSSDLYMNVEQFLRLYYTLVLLSLEFSLPSDTKLSFNARAVPYHQRALLKLESRILATSPAAVHKVCPPEPASYRRNHETGCQGYWKLLE